MGGDPLIGPVQAPDVSVMTFNVLRARPGSTGWRRRRDRIHALLRRERPTLLGAQEVLPHQADLIRASLGDDYLSVGHGRDAGGAGEGCPLFYDARRLELVRWEQVALSAHPDAPGSRSWATLHPRVLTRAAFLDRSTGADLMALNTHLDAFSPLARRRSAELLVARAGDGPAVVTGDFNARPGSPPRRILSDAGLVDSWTLAQAQLTREWATYARARRPRSGGPRIDAIHVRGCDVLRVGIEARPTHGGWPSDHLPVVAVIRVRAGRT
jgi:endonuclease/exonuclease/phosphatase family metal-dependent hydrolase